MSGAQAQTRGAVARLDTNMLAPQFRYLTSPYHRLAVVPDKGKQNVVFVGDFSGGQGNEGAVVWAPITTPPGGSLSIYFEGATASPQGIYNVRKELYVANSNASNILVLKNGSLARTLSDPGFSPVNLQVTADGTVYCANILSNTGAGDIAIYAHGAKHPTSRLVAPSFSVVIGVAVDEHGDVFASNNTAGSSGGQVIEFKGAHGSGTVLGNIPVRFAGGLYLDKRSQDLLVTDQDAQSVSVYRAPYTGSAVATYPVPNGGAAVDVALDKTGENLYFADEFGTVDVVSYPGGVYEGSYTGGTQPAGIAIRPSTRPVKAP